MIKMQTTIDQFQVYYKSAEGKRNFRSARTKFPDLTDEKWAIIHGLCYLFTVFDKATKELGAHKYPTFVSGLPCLRIIKSHLADDKMFNMDGPITDRDKFKSAFHSKFGECPFFQTVLSKLEICQKQLLEAFKRRFSGMDINIVWMLLFDPQYAPALHLSETEKASATKFMKKELQSLIVPLMTLPPPINEAGSSTEMDVVLLSEEDDDDVFDVSFEPIRTPIPTGRSSTTTFTDSPGSKLKKI